MNYLIKTNDRLITIGILLLRCIIGIILFMAGAGKVFGWFGGFGLEKTLGFYSMQGFSPLLSYLSIYIEFIGGFLLIIGLFTRLVGVPVIINMLVAFVVTVPKGFIMGGAAYPFSLLIDAIIIELTGPSTYSLDFLLFGRGKADQNLHVAPPA